VVNVTASLAVQLRPWSAADLRLLQRLYVREVRDTVGGVEMAEQVVARNERCLRLAEDAKGWMFSVAVAGVDELPDGRALPRC
jgi:hypothetical protein